MTTLIEQANALHARLTTLGKVPEGLSLVCNEWRRVSGSHSFTVSKGHALAILRDAARRECDEWGVDINPPEGNLDWHGVNGWDRTDFGHDTYESALIAGLDWIIEQRGKNV
jgi:hypothetical protein